MSFIHSFYNKDYDSEDIEDYNNSSFRFNIIKILPFIILIIVSITIIVLCVISIIKQFKLNKLKEIKEKEDNDVINSCLPIILEQQKQQFKEDDEKDNIMKETIIIKQYNITQDNKGVLNVKETTNIKSNIKDEHFNNLIKNVVDKNDVIKNKLINDQANNKEQSQKEQIKEEIKEQQ